ncbi:carbohydrate ABC transporter substrate-binding protein, CUT1 family [Caldibacillus debilis GB1]|uniref:Carbohydrate ABC transporter substrate-binding protein, CUT1 family n=2 Tax=Caldibacillus debilis TaxID=301148 RepID=A0A420VGZ0_9BACI|nr:carbohydrate ABC transporter substrate-binding protein, CUT1 family [Caldibacillus debilis GB1]
MMRWKKALSIVAVLMCLVLLFGCSGSNQSSGDNNGGGKKTIKFMHLWPEGSSKIHYNIVKKIISDFENEHPDVRVQMEVLSNEQYKEKLKILSASNELPDVGMTWAAGFLEPYVNGNKFAPLDDVVEKELKDSFVPGTVEAYAINGKTYGLPLELNIALIFYNKAIFDKYGLSAPKTYDEFKQVVETLAKNGVQPIALGNKDRWTGSLWYMYFADRMAGADVLSSALKGETSFEEPALIDAAKEVQNLVKMNAFVKGFNGLSDEEAKSMFMNGQAAMYLIGTWDLPNYTTNEDVPKEFRESIGYLKFPTVNGKGDLNSFVGGPGVGLFVSEDSKVKEEAKQFVAFFVKEWAERAVTEVGVIPATKLDTSSLDLPQMYIDVLNELNNATNLTLYADVQMPAKPAQVHLDAIQSLFGLEMTPEQFAKEHAEAISGQ